jgi:hypothetical protein
MECQIYFWDEGGYKEGLVDGGIKTGMMDDNSLFPVIEDSQRSKVIGKVG